MTALLPREPAPGAPVFAEPWHAEVLAIASALTRSGLFTSAEWAEALGAEIRRAGELGHPDTEASYYRCALAALEALVGDKSPETGGSLASRVEAWRRAYLNTPHGNPVELAAGLRHEDHIRQDGGHRATTRWTLLRLRELLAVWLPGLRHGGSRRVFF